MKKWLVRALPWLITLLLIRFLIVRGGDLHDLGVELEQVRWFWLLLAILFQAGVFGAVTWLNELLLQAYGVSVPWVRQYFIQFAMAFIETVIPSAAMSGLVLRVRLLKPYGVAPDVAIVTTLVENVAIALSVAVPTLVAGLILLAEGRLSGLYLDGLVIGLALLLGGSLIISQRWRAGHLRRPSAWIISPLSNLWDNHILKRWPGQLEAWPSSRILERLRFFWVEIIPLLRNRPHLLVSALALRTTCEAIAFIACFYAFGKDLSPFVLLFLYAITLAINTLGGLPGGVGLAEVSLASLYLQFGITPESAVAIALAYRLTGYWLPRVVGGLAWLWLEYLHHSDALPQNLKV